MIVSSGDSLWSSSLVETVDGIVVGNRISWWFSIVESAGGKSLLVETAGLQLVLVSWSYRIKQVV